MRLLSILLGLLLGLATLSCSKDSPAPPPDLSRQKTLFVYMPWSTDLDGYFKVNIADLEKAIKTHGLRKERVIVFFATSPTKADMFEIVYTGNACSHQLLKSYDNPQHTTAEGLSAIFSDVKGFAPAELYALIIGAHGSGWLPRGTPLTDEVSTGLSVQQVVCTPQLTRCFGGLTKELQADISTLAESSRRAGLHWEFILFDDCLMSSVEVAYELRDVTDHLVACPTEIMKYGMPYAVIGPNLLGNPDYQAICNGFLSFYSSYYYPYGTIGVTDCRELDSLASSMREINRLCAGRTVDPKAVQSMDGLFTSIFFDLKSYVTALCPDARLLDAFLRQLDRTVPCSAHTEKYYSERRGAVAINSYCGITTSAPSLNKAAKDWSETSWYKATH